MAYRHTAKGCGQARCLRCLTPVAQAIAANIASTRVMEKCAMTFQGHRTDRWKKLDHPVDLALYAVTRREWDAFASVGFEAHA